MKKTLYAALFSLSLASLPIGAMACDGMGPSKHMGSITSVNAADKTFTIRDAQLQVPITFKASDEIIQAVSDAQGGSIMVNYEENEGTLTALGVVL